MVGRFASGRGRRLRCCCNAAAFMKYERQEHLTHVSPNRHAQLVQHRPRKSMRNDVKCCHTSN